MKRLFPEPFEEAAHAGRPFIIGMPGCGKSTVAGRSWPALGLPKCDTDTLLEQRLGSADSRSTSPATARPRPVSMKQMP